MTEKQPAQVAPEHQAEINAMTAAAEARQGREIAALHNLAQVAEQVLRDMQAQDLMMEWHTVLEEAIAATQAVRP